MKKNLILVSAVLGCMAALPAYAVTSSSSGTFTTTNQSEWSGGPATVLSYTSPTIGPPPINGSATIGTVGCDVTGCYGTQASLSINGNMGLQFSASLNSGSVNASVPFSSTITAPSQVYVNNVQTTGIIPTVNINLGQSQLQVFAPTAQAALNMPLSLDASGSAEVCFIKCASTSGTIVNGSTTLPLLSINNNNNGKVQAMGQTVTGLSGSVGPVSFSVQGPQNTPNATGASGGFVATSASTDVVSVGVDVVQAIADALEAPVDGSYGPLSYSLASGSVTLDGYLNQSFNLNPSITTDLYVPLTGQTVLCTVTGGCGAINVPTGFTGQLQVDPSYLVDAAFSNTTGLQLKPGFAFSLLSGSVTGLGTIGPAYSYSHQFNTPTIQMYANNFALGGFSSIAGTSFSIDVLPTPAPEPSTLSLLAIGLLGVGFALAQRRRTA